MKEYTQQIIIEKKQFTEIQEMLKNKKHPNYKKYPLLDIEKEYPDGFSVILQVVPSDNQFDRPYIQVIFLDKQKKQLSWSDPENELVDEDSYSFETKETKYTLILKKGK